MYLSKHTFKTIVTILLAAASLLYVCSCSDLFTNPDDDDGTSLCINLAGVIGRGGGYNSRGATVSSDGYTAKLTIYNAETNEVLASNDESISISGSATITSGSIAPGTSIYVHVAIYNGSELLYERTSNSQTLHNGKNTVSFTTDSVPVLLYTNKSYNPNAKNAILKYTTIAAPSGGQTITSIDFEHLEWQDFDAEGNIYVVYVASPGDNINLIKISQNGSISTILSNQNTFLVCAVDRTQKLLHCINIDSETLTTYSLPSLTPIATKNYISSIYRESKLTASNGTLYEAFPEDGTLSIHRFTITSTSITPSGQISVSIGDSTLFADAERFSTGGLGAIAASDLKYYNGNLWLVINQTIYSAICTSRGAVARISPNDTEVTLNSSNISGWTTDKTNTGTNTKSYRPGATTGARDTISNTCFYGPYRFLALTPKRLFISDTGYYISEYDEAALYPYHAKPIARIAEYNSVTDSLGFTKTDDSIVFDNDPNNTSADGSYTYN